jgi:heptosyltransferase-1
MRVLIVRTGAMGDVLHALPAVAALRGAQPDATIDWVIDQRWSALLEAEAPNPIVDTVHPVDLKRWKQAPHSPATLRSLFAFRHLRRLHYDHVLDMQGTLRSATIGRLAGSRALAGYADPREPLATTFYTRKLIRRGVHVVDQGAGLLSDVTGLTLSPAAVTLPHTAWADDWATEFVAGRRICLLCPSAGWPAKQWPATHFATLAKSLHALGLQPLVNAPRKDDPLANAVVAASEGTAQLTVCNVAGLIALTRKATLLVGGDSGPTHLAAALAVPTVALFGPTDPARNGPWGSGPVRILRDPASATTYKRSAAPDPGLANLSAEAVLAAARELLGVRSESI